MYLAFGRKLLRLGKLRIGFGIRMKGWTAACMVFVYAMMYMCWYMTIGMIWLMYGMGYLCVYLPVKGIVKLSNRNKAKQSPQT